MALSTPTTWLSIGCATVASTTAAEAPGYVVVTETCGGTMSGYCATGITKMDRMPAIVVTMAMTAASRGRWTKTLESIGSAPACRRRYRCRAHGRAGAQAFHSLHDDLLPAGEAAVENRLGSLLAADLDPADLRLTVLGDEQIRALLVGEQRHLRHQHLLFRPVALHRYADKLPVDQSSVRVRNGAAHQHGVGGAVHRHIE